MTKSWSSGTTGNELEQKKTRTLKNVSDTDGKQESVKQTPLLAAMESAWSKRCYPGRPA